MNEFKPPEPLIFSGNLSENWRRWEQRFDLYLAASGKVKENEKTQVAILLHLLGEEEIEIFNNFTFTAEGENKDNLSCVKGKFKNNCNPRKNTVIERYTFWETKQKEGESIDHFVTELKTKAKNCEFEAQKDLMIRDRIIFGIQDERLKERLLRETENPTLEKAIEMCRAAEISKKQIKTLQGEIPVDAIKKRHDRGNSGASGHRSNPAPGNFGHKKENPKRSESSSHSSMGASSTPHRYQPAHAGNRKRQKEFNCNKCGTRHVQNYCPAYGKKCKTCKKYNHFTKQCFYNKKMHEVDIDSTESEDESEHPFFVGVLNKVHSVISEEDKSWYSLLKIEDKTVKFKLDTGAEANVIPQNLFYKLPHNQLKDTKTKLSTYGNNVVTPLGKTKLTCETKSTNIKQDLDFYVVNFQATPILGLEACKTLKLLEKVDIVKNEHQKVTMNTLLKDYKDNFKGLGKFEGQYKIELNSDARPVINPPRVVPQTLLPKLKEALDKLESNGVITAVEEATDWVNNLVIVEKPNGALRLCLDPRELNKAIKRQHFQIPTLNDITAKLNGKTLLYHQVELDTSSSYLCTFQTPFGRYRYRRMPFGISSASEVFQRKNIQTFGDIQGVHMIHDDMIIAGADEKEHDEILSKVMKRAQEKNIKFNKDKIQFKVKEVRYMGSILGKDGSKPDPEKLKAIAEMPDPKDKKGIERFLGTINFLVPYIPNMSDITAPIRELLKRDITFEWQHERKKALDKIKMILTSNPVLKLYGVTKNVTIQTDSSQDGLGSCLLQEGHPIAYASRSLTEAEKNYAQIERELLAIVFACEKFNQYIYGKEVTVQTDHKPLQAIQSKPLHKAPPRLQRMLLRLQKMILISNTHQERTCTWQIHFHVHISKQR